MMDVRHTSRRTFLKNAGLAAAGFTLLGAMGMPSRLFAAAPFATGRPAPSARKFVSKAVDAKIEEIKGNIADRELAWMFENCFPNTLDTTVTFGELDGKPDSFVITGDIDAMWLRDSTGQVWPYLPLMKEDAQLQRMVAGLVHRQTRCILLDPYANAFYRTTEEEGHWKTDKTEMKKGVHERKWEIDSLCYAVRLAHGYWKQTGDTAVFDADWQRAMELVYQTFRQQQRKDAQGPYSFMRNTTRQTDTVPGFGWGNPVRPNGLICSTFRPSDDATTYLYLIPSNYFAAVSLEQLSEIYTQLGERDKAARFADFAKEVRQALQHAKVRHPKYGEILAFEVDGFGNALMMDDANVPSLLSLPYLGGIGHKDPLYKRTRAFIWSEDNPFFARGKAGEGIGGPHVGKDYPWPMSMIMRGLTSQDDREIVDCLRHLKATHAGTGFMHEGFHKDDARKFTRHWFAWVNTLFGELMLKVYRERPHLLAKEI